MVVLGKRYVIQRKSDGLFMKGGKYSHYDGSSTPIGWGVLDKARIFSKKHHALPKYFALSKAIDDFQLVEIGLDVLDIV